MGRPRVIGGITLGEGRPRIVAAGGEHELAALAGADMADLVEARVDLFDDPQPDTLPATLGRLRSAGRPLIVTVRAASEGGWPLPEERRRDLYAAGLAVADAIDVEIASTELAAALVPAARRAGRTVILSTHDFETMPPRTEILARVARAFDAGADVAKVAAHAASLAALRVLIDVTRGVSPSPIATLAMGPMGPLSRLVLPAAGSLLTYAAAGAPTAPGQLPLDELAALFDRLLPR